MSIATPDNLGKIWGLVTIASIGVGAVIIPCSIVAQIVCPKELIGTITAITLSIRYIGGAIGFTAYYNVFYHKFEQYASTIVAGAIVQYKIADPRTPQGLQAIKSMIGLAGQARYEELHGLIAQSPYIGQKNIAYDVIIESSQEAFALAYRYPYWMSIAFGGICLICSLGLKDIRKCL